MVRSKVLGVRLTDPEYERVLEMTRRAERTPSDFVRLLLLNVKPETVNSGLPEPPALQEAIRGGGKPTAA